MSAEDVAGRVLLPKSVTPSHYTLELTPDLTALTFLGNQTVKVNVSESTHTITMHAKEIEITSATYAGENMISISYDLKYHTVTLGFENALPLGEGVLSLKFKGILNGDMNGFYKSSYTDAKGNKKIVASTQFEALDARRAFPCWDEPAQKCTFDISLIVANNLCAVSNMPEVRVTSIANTDLKKIEFDTTPKMSTYLVAFCVGEFDWISAKSQGGVVVRVITPPGRSEEGRFALDVAVKSLDFYDEFFQVKYPLPKLDMICITEFAMGAMENWGLVTYRETALMVDEARASVQNKQRVAIVVAHELAHQWFGNLVTMEWWDGLWLNEGFAAFMEHFAVDAILPEYKIWEQFTTEAFSHAQRLDSLRSSHPIIVPIKHAEEVEQVFDAISYCKGSCVVNMIYSTLGPDRFREGLRVYMKRHQYGNTETKDLWNCWTEATGGSIDVAEMMDSWTTKLGYPMVVVEHESWTNNDVTFTLRQEKFLSDGSKQAGDSDTVWHIPLLFTTSTSLSPTAVVMNQKVQTFTVPLSGAADYIKINAGQKALLRVSHSRQMLQRLVDHAIPSGSLSDVDVASLLLDAYALCKAKAMPVQDLVLVMKSVSPNSRSLVIWTAIQSVYTAINLFMEDIGGSALSDFQSFAKKFVATALAQIGWEASASDNHTDKLVRSIIVNMLDTFAWNDESVVAECRRRFEGHFADASLLPNEYKATVYKIVLMNGGVTEYNKILGVFKGTEDNSEKMKVYTSLGATQSEELKLKTLNWAYFDEEVKLQDFFYCIGPVANSKEGAALAWKFYKDNFEAVKQKLKKASSSLMDAVIALSTSRFTSLESAAEIEAFFAAHPMPQSSRRISQILENMRANAQFLEAFRAAGALHWE